MGRVSVTSRRPRITDHPSLFTSKMFFLASMIAPIIAKPLVAAGVDPVHLGMVVVFNLMIGLLTPPMGLALFLVAEIAKVRMQDVLKEMLPYYIPLVITLLLITYFPAITTWIPHLALGN